MRVRQIAELLHGTVAGDPETEIQGVAALESAGPAELAYAEDSAALGRTARSRAGCLLVPLGAAPLGRTSIALPHPKLGLIRAAEFLHQAAPAAPGTHPTAVVAPDAQLGPDCGVDAHAVIERGVTVGRGTRVGAGVFLGEGVCVGADCVFDPHVTVYPGARIGDRVVLHAGVVVGSDGFGYVLAEGRQNKFPQLGKIIIEDDVEIGSNTTLDRGSLGVTVVGQGTKIDNLVQIAHNVKIGRHCIIAAQTGISGSVELGDYVVMGGQVGVGDHVRIEDHAVAGGGAGVLPGKVVRRGSVIWGRPSRPLSEFKRNWARFSRLEALARRVANLESEISNLKSR